MENSISQLYTLLVFLISGAIIGILFDLFRILRKSFKTSDIVTYIQDILFWIITGIFLLYIIFTYSFGEIRVYMFVSLIIGSITYFLTISKYFIKINVKLIQILKISISKIIYILLYPIKIVIKILQKTILKPFSFITINVRKFYQANFKNLTKTLKSVNISKKNRKNLKQKKDFPI